MEKRTSGAKQAAEKGIAVKGVEGYELSAHNL
jgi:hypothetical protein